MFHNQQMHGSPSAIRKGSTKKKKKKNSFTEVSSMLPESLMMASHETATFTVNNAPASLLNILPLSALPDLHVYSPYRTFC